VAHEHIEKKWQEWKVEEVRKAEEAQKAEEVQKVEEACVEGGGSAEGRGRKGVEMERGGGPGAQRKGPG